jgi:hypothetical protein
MNENRVSDGGLRCKLPSASDLMVRTISMTGHDVDTLLQQAKETAVSESEREAQRRSFVFGNTKIEFDALTPAVVAEIAEQMAQASEKNG